MTKPHPVVRVDQAHDVAHRAVPAHVDEEDGEAARAVGRSGGWAVGRLGGPGPASALKRRATAVGAWGWAVTSASRGQSAEECVVEGGPVIKPHVWLWLKDNPPPPGHSPSTTSTAAAPTAATTRDPTPLCGRPSTGGRPLSPRQGSPVPAQGPAQGTAQHARRPDGGCLRMLT
jgi:hypothetical protein